MNSFCYEKRYCPNAKHDGYIHLKSLRICEIVLTAAAASKVANCNMSVICLCISRTHFYSCKIIPCCSDARARLYTASGGGDVTAPPPAPLARRHTPGNTFRDSSSRFLSSIRHTLTRQHPADGHCRV